MVNTVRKKKKRKENNYKQSVSPQQVQSLLLSTTDHKGGLSYSSQMSCYSRVESISTDWTTTCHYVAPAATQPAHSRKTLLRERGDNRQKKGYKKSTLGHHKMEEKVRTLPTIQNRSCVRPLSDLVAKEIYCCFVFLTGTEVGRPVW